MPYVPVETHSNEVKSVPAALVVATAFLRKPEVQSDVLVECIDGNPGNIHKDNLRWVPPPGEYMCEKWAQVDSEGTFEVSSYGRVR